MKKKKGNEVLQDLDTLMVLPIQTELRLLEEIEKLLEISIKKSKKKLNKTKNQFKQDKDYTDLFLQYAANL